MSDSEHRRVLPFYWIAILVLAALLAGAVFLLLRPNPPSSDSADGQTQQGESEPSPTDGADSEPETPEETTTTDDEIPETGPLRAKLSDAVAGFAVDSWVESAGLLKFGAVEAYEGFYVQVESAPDTAGDETDGGTEVEIDDGLAEPTLIAAGRWKSAEDATEWLEDWVEQQAVLPAEFKAEGMVPGVGETEVGTYRYYESPDETEAGVVWTNNDLGLVLIGEPKVVELLFTQLPL